MQLVPNWRKAWRMLSVQIPAVNVAFLSTWAVLPPKFQDVLPTPWVVAVTVGLLILGVVGRLIDQPETKEATCDS